MFTAIYLLGLMLAPAAFAASSGEIDLELDKSVSPQLVEVGGQVVWTISVSNVGTADATGVEVGDVLPAGLTYVSHSGQGALDPGSGTWTIGSIPLGETRTMAIVTTAEVVGDIVNVAEVTMADQEDLDSVPGDGEGDDWDDATIRVISQGSELIDLELTKSADPAAVVVGDETTWTVDLTNQGPDDATGVEVSVTPPSGVTYVSHTGDGTFDPGSGTWTVGSLAAGAVVQLHITTTVDVAGSLTCVAEVTMADQEDVDSIPGDGTGDDWDDATVSSSGRTGDLIDLELTKSADPVNLEIGDETVWTIDLTNQGPDDATGVEVLVEAPIGGGLTYVSHTGDGSFDPQSGTWTVGDLAVGEVVSLSITTTVTRLGDITCVAEVTMADQEDVDSTPGDGEGDDWDDATVTVTGTGDELIDLELTKSVNPAVVAVGDDTTWNIVLTNQGPDDATGVEVTVEPPAEVSYVSHSGDGSFDAGTGVWTIGDLAVGETVALDIVTTVNELGSFTCVAEVTAADQEDIDSVPGDGEGDDWDDATVESTETGSELIDLELTKTVDPANTTVGSDVVWSIELTNQGPADATGVEVTVTPPAGVEYVSHIGIGDFDSTTGLWTVGDVAVGEVITLDITTTVTADGDWVCVAEVTAADQEDVDSVPGDGEGDDWDDAEITTSDPGAGIIDLELTKTADPTTVSLGDETEWTIELTNRGPDDATGVAVTVSPPPQVTYVSHFGDGDFDPTTGVWTVGDLAVDQVVTLTIATSVDEIGIWTCVAEVTAADQEDIDSTPGDGEGDDWDDATVEASSVQASALIGDTVWLDTDADGVQDAGELGLGGVVLTLTNTGTGATSTQTTNSDGLYLFSALEPGDYTVIIDMTTVDDKLGLTTAGSFSVSLADNDAFLTADFGLAETLPVTGFDPVPISLAGLILALLGAVALELTWPERAGRKAFLEHNA